MAYGMNGHCAIGFQDSYGTSNVDSLHYFPMISESINESIPPLLDEGMRGRFEEGESYEGPHDINGDLVTNIHPILFGKLLAAWCGQSSADPVGSGCISHQFIPKTSDFDELAATPPCTIEIYRDAGSASLYYDMCLDALAIEFAHGALIKNTASWVGGKFSKAVKTSPTYLAGSSFTWDVTSISWNGVAIDEYENITVTFGNALEAKGTLNGSKYANRTKRSGYRTITIAGTILFVNQTEVDLFRAQTKQRLVITSKVGSNMIELDFPAMRYDEFPANIGGMGLISVGFSATVKYHADSGTMFEGTVVNSQETYRGL